MATIRTAIQIQDGMSSPMKSMVSSIESANRAFLALQATSANAVDVANMNAMRNEVSRLNGLVNGVEKNIQEATAAQQQFNNTVQNTHSAVDGLVGKFKSIVSVVAMVTGAKAAMDLSDTVAQNTARIDLMNDGLQSTAELQEKIFQSAQRSRGIYQTTLEAVSKLGMQAAQSFKSNDELIAFTEQLNKTFVVARTSAVGVDSVMLQLTQSMAAGKLQGEELNAVLDNAAPIVANIQRYLQNVQGMPKSVTDNIKQLASDGVITAEVIKNAMFYAAEETNRKFESMPLTFNDAWNSIRNVSLKAFQPVLQMINGLANNRTFDTLAAGAANGLSMLGNMTTQAFTAVSNTITWGIQAASSAFMFFGNLLWGIMPYAIGALATYGTYWLTVNGNMVMNSAIASIVAARTWGITTAQTAWALVTGRLTAAQWSLNLALLFNPVELIIALIIGAIAIFAAWQVKTYGLRNTFADVFGFIVDTVQSAVNFIVASINTVIRSFNSIGGFAGKVMGFEYSQIAEIAYRADFSGIKSAGQNFIKDFSMDSLFKAPDMAATTANNFNNFFDPAAAANIADTAANTGKMKDSLDISSESLQYLRDIAEQEVINRFTTADIKVEMGGVHNTVNSNMDLDGMATYLKDTLVEAVQTAAEEVHK
jgi:tape measure domain-containing protein